MGQYHTIYNITKKETFSIGGAKLLEKAFTPAFNTALLVLLSNSNGRGGGDLYVHREYSKKTHKPLKLKGRAATVDAALQRVQGRWAGDAVVLQGDYAEPADSAFITDTVDFTDITESVLTALEASPEFTEFIKDERNWRRAESARLKRKAKEQP